jgi:MYXO-CTERM domain-containing protein
VTWSTGTGQSCGSVTDDTGQNHQEGCFYDADIELNDRDYFWTTDGSNTDIQSIAVHEYGHFTGMDHCTDNNTCQVGTGIMSAAYPGGIIRSLFNDDVQGACSLYPGTPGGVGWPCNANNQCNSNICVNPGNNGYCTETCGTCTQGFVCDANPQNANQMVCLRDDGLNKGQCEVCQLGLPMACIDNGICVRGLPSNTEGRCVQPCRTNRVCDMDYQCLTVQFQDGTSEDYCFPGSNDCNDPGNFTTLQLGQTCTGNPPCAAGLECVGSGTAGICSPECTGNPSSCPQSWTCADFQGGVSYCLPSVNEGQACEGNVACGVGPCLITGAGGSAVCYRDCASDPNVCNNAQSCTTYQLQGGGSVSICEPPGVPPRPDGGVVDTGMIDPDSGMIGDDAGTIDKDGGTVQNDAGQTGTCECDITFSCDPSCSHCDPECVACECDLTTACDPGCGSCDPECRGGEEPERSGCTGCTSTEHPTDPLVSGLVGLLLIGLFLGRKRR